MDSWKCVLDLGSLKADSETKFCVGIIPFRGNPRKCWLRSGAVSWGKYCITTGTQSSPRDMDLSHRWYGISLRVLLKSYQCLSAIKCLPGISLLGLPQERHLSGELLRKALGQRQGGWFQEETVGSNRYGKCWGNMGELCDTIFYTGN